MWQRLLVLILISLSCTACDFPKDPEGTLDRARGGTIRVGVVENEPWVKKVENQPAGVEVELIRRFAEEIGAQVEWVWGTEQSHMEALAQYELDLIIAGLTYPNPWEGHVGLTTPYYQSRVVVGVPPTLPPLQNLAGVEVIVEEGEATAAHLKEEEAFPVRVEKLSPEVGGPIAAPEWQLKTWGFTLMDIELHENKHVMAVAPGENGWLVALEKFLLAHQPEIEPLLAKELAP